ncbi:MAG: V-type ATP synthase subunit E [Candidatus Hodarchaeales archaeon]|jgi:vacuolar-type H+-ATPase subunit E/Vma4
MKSADALIEALLSEAHETAEKIIQDARKAAQGTLDEQRKKGRERARDIVISIDKKAQNDSEIIKLRNTSSAESKAKWLILKKKHELIENVLNQVKDELRKRIKLKDYIHVLENFILEGGIIVGATELEVILNERDSTLSLDLDKLAEKIGEETGKKTKITKSAKKIDTIGGVIIQSIDGKIVMNNTFEGILNYSESEIRFKIAQILFT